MAGWFKKKKPEDVPLEVEQFFNKHLGPILLLTETAENISTYFKRVEGEEISFPAYKRKGSSILEVWIDTRLELLHYLWQNFDDFNPAILAERKRQKELFACIQEANIEYDSYGEGLYKYTSTVTNLSNEHKGMINALITMYEALLNISDEIGVQEPDIAMGRKSVKLDIISLSEGDQILESIMGCKELLEKVEGGNVAWVNYYNKLDAKDLIPSCPKTISEIIIEDITKKSKLIALTAVSGPNYRSNYIKLINFIANKAIKDGMSPEEAKEQANEQQELFDCITNAEKPEDVIKYMKRNKTGWYRET